MDIMIQHWGSDQETEQNGADGSDEGGPGGPADHDHDDDGDDANDAGGPPDDDGLAGANAAAVATSSPPTPASIERDVGSDSELDDEFPSLRGDLQSMLGIEEAPSEVAGLSPSQVASGSGLSPPTTPVADPPEPTLPASPAPYNALSLPAEAAVVPGNPEEAFTHETIEYPPTPEALADKSFPPRKTAFRDDSVRDPERLAKMQQRYHELQLLGFVD